MFATLLFFFLILLYLLLGPDCNIIIGFQDNMYGTPFYIYFAKWNIWLWPHLWLSQNLLWNLLLFPILQEVLEPTLNLYRVCIVCNTFKHNCFCLSWSTTFCTEKIAFDVFIKWCTAWWKDIEYNLKNFQWDVHRVKSTR